VNIKGSIGYFVYDVIDGGYGPCEKKGEQAFAAEKQNRSGRNHFPV